MSNENDLHGDQPRDAPPQLSDGIRTHRCGCECSQNIGEGNDAASTVSEPSSSNVNATRTESSNGNNSFHTETFATVSETDIEVPDQDASNTTIEDTASESTDADVLNHHRLRVSHGCTCKNCTCLGCNLRQFVCTLVDIDRRDAMGHSPPSSTPADSGSSSETSLASSALLGAHWRSEPADLAHMGEGFDYDITYDPHLEIDVVVVVRDDNEADV